MITGAREGLTPARSRRIALSLSRPRQLALAYLVALIPAVAVAILQPVWQLTDEAQHYDVIAHYASGVYPIEGRTTLRPETVEIMKRTGVYRWSPPETLPQPAVLEPAQFESAPTYLHGYAYQLWVRRHIWWFSYESMQPPLFYLLATPVFAAAVHLHGPLAAVYAVRGLDCLLLALLAPLVLLTSWALLPRRRGPALAAALVTAAFPGLLLNGTQITNDTLGAVGGAVCVLLAVLAARRGWGWRLSVAIGLAFGLTLLAKLTAAGLAVGLLAAWLWPLLQRRQTLAYQLRAGALAAAVALLVLAPWLLLNLHAYGHAVPDAEARLLLGAGTSAGSYSFFQSVDYAFTTFWTGEHRDTLPFTGLLTAFSVVWAGVCVVGILRVVRRQALLGIHRPALLVLVAAVGGQLAWALAVPTVSGIGGMTPGRYLYPVIAPAIVLLVAGSWAALQTAPWKAIFLGGFALLSAGNFVWYGLGHSAVPYEERRGPWPGYATRDVYAEGGFGGAAITVDRVMEDRRSNGVWVHLTAVNKGAQALDWWPGPAVQVAGTKILRRADYAASTPFPETLLPMSEYSGWVKLNLKPAELGDRGLKLTFEDVAVDQYRAIGTISVLLPGA